METTTTEFTPSIARAVNFDVIRCTSCDPIYPATNLHHRSTQQKGWVCERFSEYPQKLIIELKNITHIEKLDLIAHEMLIPRQVDIYINNPSSSTKDSINNDVDTIVWKRLGHINFASPDSRECAARELKGVFLDVDCKFLRLDLQRPHISRNNLFGQVSLCNIVPYGFKLKKSKTLENSLAKQYQNSQQNKKDQKNIKNNDNNEINATEIEGNTDLDPISRKICNDLVLLKEDAISHEDYHSARDLKKAEQQVRSAGANIVRLLIEKNISISSEDFDRASQIKEEINRLKRFVNQLPQSLGCYKKLLEEREAANERETNKRKHEYERRYKWNDKKGEESLSEFTGVAENMERGNLAASTIQKHYKNKILDQRIIKPVVEIKENDVDAFEKGKRVNKFESEPQWNTTVVDEFNSPSRSNNNNGDGNNIDLFESVNLDKQQDLFVAHSHTHLPYTTSKHKKQQQQQQQQNRSETPSSSSSPLPQINTQNRVTFEQPEHATPNIPTIPTTPTTPTTEKRNGNRPTPRQQKINPREEGLEINVLPSTQPSTLPQYSDQTDLRMLHKVPASEKHIQEAAAAKAKRDRDLEELEIKAKQAKEAKDARDADLAAIKAKELLNPGPEDVPYTPSRPALSNNQRPRSRQITGTASRNSYPLPEPISNNNNNNDNGDAEVENINQRNRPRSREIPTTPVIPASFTEPSALKQRDPSLPDPWDGLNNTRDLESPEPLDPVINNSKEFVGIKNIFGQYVLRSLLSKNWKLRYAGVRKIIHEVEQMPKKNEFSGKVLECVCKIIEISSKEKVVVINVSVFRLFELILQISESTKEEEKMSCQKEEEEKKEKGENEKNEKKDNKKIFDVSDSDDEEKKETKNNKRTSSRLKFNRDICRARIKTYARAQIIRLGDSNERISIVAQQCLDLMCSDPMHFIGTSIVVPLLRETSSSKTNKDSASLNTSWRLVLGRLNYIQMLIGRYHFSTKGFMTTKDVVNMMIEYDAGMHANSSVREQSKLLCTLIWEHENEIEKMKLEKNEFDVSDSENEDEDGDGKKNKKKKHVLGTKGKAILEPFLSSLYDDRRIEFENEIFNETDQQNNDKERKKNAERIANPKSKSTSKKKKKGKKHHKSSKPSTGKEKGKEEKEKEKESETAAPIQKMTADSFASGGELITVIFGKGSLGMKLNSAKNNKGAIISSINDKGAADMLNKLKVGDELLKIDGEKITSKTMKDIVQLIGKSKRPCKFLFSR